MTTRIDNWQLIRKPSISLFEQYCVELQNEFSTFAFSVYDYSLAQVGEQFSAALGIDAQLLNCFDDVSDCLSMELFAVGLSREDLHVNGKVGWGNPCGQIVTRIFPEPIKLSQNSVEAIFSEIPLLRDYLRKEILSNPKAMKCNL